MKNTVIKINIEIDDVPYFEGLGELLGHQVKELCSRGCMTIPEAAKIYKILGEKLNSFYEEEGLAKWCEAVSREGFSELYNEDEKAKEESHTGKNINDYQPSEGFQIYSSEEHQLDLEHEQSPWGLVRKFENSIQVKKVDAIIEKYVDYEKNDNLSDIDIFYKHIVPRLNDFKTASDVFEDILAKSKLKRFKNEKSWKAQATIEELMSGGDSIIFTEHFQYNYKWNRFISDCILYAAFSDCDSELESFLDAYKVFPAIYQYTSVEKIKEMVINNHAFKVRLSQQLIKGMFIKDVSELDEEYREIYQTHCGLKTYLDELVENGHVIKEKKMNRVYYRTEKKLWYSAERN